VARTIEKHKKTHPAAAARISCLFAFVKADRMEANKRVEIRRIAMITAYALLTRSWWMDRKKRTYTGTTRRNRMSPVIRSVTKVLMRSRS
jgi:hypothetical protein